MKLRGKSLVATLAGVLALAAVGLGALAARPSASVLLTDGKEIRTQEERAQVRRVLWTPAKPVAVASGDGSAVADSSVDEYEPRFSADGTTMVFVRRRPGSNADLFSARWTPGGWTEAAPIEELNSGDDELGPELSWDGSALYFYSDRPGGLGGHDIWVSRRGDGRWSTPVNMGQGVNSNHNEYGPALTPDGNTLYFSSNRPREGEPAPQSEAWTATVRERRDRHDYDLYASVITGGEAGPAAAVRALNTVKDEGSPSVSPAGDFVYFASDRAGGLGGYDLYRARLGASGIQAAENLGEAVNSASNELDPGLSADGFRLCFSSDRVMAPAQDAMSDGAEPQLGETGMQGTADAPSAANEPHYHLFGSVSREVYIDIDRSRSDAWLGELWDSLWPWLALLIAAALLAWLLFYLLRSEAWRRRFGRLNLLAQCVLVSLLIHAVVASLLAAWKVGSGIIELVERSGSGGSRVILASSGLAGDAAGQIMGSAGDGGNLVLPTLMSISADAPSMELPTPDARVAIPDAAPIAGLEAVKDERALEASPATSARVPDAVPDAPDATETSAQVPRLQTAEDAKAEVSAAGTRQMESAVAAGVEARLDSQVRREVAIPSVASPAREANVGGRVEEAAPVSVHEAVQAPAMASGGPQVGVPAAIAPAGGKEAEAAKLDRMSSPLVSDVSAGTTEAPTFSMALPASSIGLAGPAAGDERAVGGARRENHPPAASSGAGVTVPSPASGASLTEVGIPAAVAGRAEGEVTLGRGGVAPVEAAAMETEAGGGAARVEVRPPAGSIGNGAMEIREAASQEINGLRSASVALRAPAPAGNAGSPNVGLPKVGEAREGAHAAAEPSAGSGRGSAPARLAAAPVAGSAGEGSSPRVMLAIPGSRREGSGSAASPDLSVPEAGRFAAPGAGVTGGALGSARSEFPGVRLPESPPENVAPVETFDQRAPDVRAEVLEQMGGSRETEAAVRRALDWLARHQESDGRWTGRDFDEGCGKCDGEAAFDADAAMTGMALLCYLGAGHTHLADGPYRDVVGKGIQWLLLRQGPDGDLRRGETMYGQTVSTVALCEALAMTSDPRLGGPTRRAVELVMNVANRPRGGVRREEDTSVIGWLVMTVESARRAGIAVTRDTFESAGRWLDSVSTAREPGLYSYRKGESPSIAMTAEAMFVQQILGRQRTEERMKQSAEFLLNSPPRWEEGAPTYCWYYETLALFEHQGEAWKKWNEAIMPQLIEHQRRDGGADGSWDPQDEWSRMGGRIYQTAVCTLCLEVYYRYKPHGDGEGAKASQREARSPRSP